jgi:rhodanese-related sulfurtransferase
MVGKSLSELLEEARAGLRRMTPKDLCDRLAQNDGTVVLDTRTPTDRAAYGCIPGSLHTPRTVLEWRVALDAPLRLPQISSHEQLLVVVCNEGFSSSLAARSLQALGFALATDLVGGVIGWRDAGFPVVAAAGDEIGIRHDAEVQELQELHVDELALGM